MGGSICLINSVGNAKVQARLLIIIKKTYFPIVLIGLDIPSTAVISYNQNNYFRL